MYDAIVLPPNTETQLGALTRYAHLPPPLRMGHIIIHPSTSRKPVSPINDIQKRRGGYPIP